MLDQDDVGAPTSSFFDDLSYSHLQTTPNRIWPLSAAAPRLSPLLGPPLEHQEENDCRRPPPPQQRQPPRRSPYALLPTTKKREATIVGTTGSHFLSLTMKTTILRMTTVWILTWTCDTPLKWMVDR